MPTIKLIDKVFCLVFFAMAVFGFVYHISEDWVIALIASSNLFFSTTILMAIRHEKLLRDFEKSISDRSHKRKINRRVGRYARAVQNK